MVTKPDRSLVPVDRAAIRQVVEELEGEQLKRIMTTEQAARYLSCDAGWLEILRHKGGGPKFSKLGRLVRYRRDDLDAWVEEHIQANTSEG